MPGPTPLQVGAILSTDCILPVNMSSYTHFECVSVSCCQSFHEALTPALKCTTRLSFINNSCFLMHTGFEQAVDSCKSLLLTCALFEGQVSPQQASDLARLETRHQVHNYMYICRCS